MDYLRNTRQRGSEPEREGAHDRAEAPARGLCRTPVVAARQTIYYILMKNVRVNGNPNEKCAVQWESQPDHPSRPIKT